MAATRMLLAFLILVVACDNATEPDPFEIRAIPEELRGAADEVVAANNEFACDLYRAVSSEPGNLFMSPYSIATALSMTYAGAAGTTAQEMAQVLHIPGSAPQWHEASGALLESLNRGVSLGGYELAIANRLWGQTGYVFLEAFLTILRDAYQAPLEQLDFARDPEAARLIINQWVEDQTHDRIRDLIPPGVLDALTRLVLTNAIYFKGTWLTQFDPDDTEEGLFWVAPGQSVQAQLMRMEASAHRCASLPSLQVLELPYKGEDLSMVILLPYQIDGLPALESEVTATKLDEWYDALYDAEVEIILPRWTFTSAFGLVDALSALGMPSAFDPFLADFSGMNGCRDLVVQDVIHKAFVAVNEEGTEAAAATAVVVGETSAGPSFEATHPFLFYIRDNVTGSILFLGRVVDPTAE